MTTRTGRAAHILHRHGYDWVTAAGACALLGQDITEDMIYDWWRRGLVKKISNGRVALYLWSQVKTAEARTAASKAGRKRKVGELG